MTFNRSQFVTGRMLSLASSDDGKLVFAGSLSSNVWASEDGGFSWDQLVWPQPPADQFGVPGSMGGFCVTALVVSPDSGRWFVERDPRFLADLTGSGRADIIGFGESGVWTALSKGDGTFQPPQVVLANFGYQAGEWRVEKHPRLLADVRGNGRADIVGFGDAGVYVAIGNGDGTFQDAQLVIPDFGYEAGSWHVEKHPRFLADLRGNGRPDIVGFGDAGVYVALGNGDGTFQDAHLVIQDFGYEAGSWRVEKHPRLLADVRGNGRADIVGFGDSGVYVALGNGDGTFQDAQLVIQDFGYEAGSWHVDKHPRFLADLTGNGRADIVGFGDGGVYIALSNGDGTFQDPQLVIPDFGYVAGTWRVEKHPRFLADLTGNGRADIVGFGDTGVYVALSNGDGTFTFQPQAVVADFGYEAGSWHVEKHLRLLAGLRGNGRADIVGFGDAGVYVALSNGDGTFQAPQFARANFGYDITVIAISRSDRELEDSGVWRSTDRGRNWTRVHQFARAYSNVGTSPPPPAGQLAWALGTDNLVYAAGASGLAVSRNGGATFDNAIPLGSGQFAPIDHVAVAATPAGKVTPPVVYALGDGRMFVSFDGGANWIEDSGPVPSDAGGAVGLSNSQAASVLVVSPRSPLEVFLTANANVPDPMLRHGDYRQFFVTHQSIWEPFTLPDLGPQYSGNVFVAVTQPGHGDVLYYSPQRANTFVVSLDPDSPSGWQSLQVVHVDLHGIFLSSDFVAMFEHGNYESKAGTAWILSDGGIHWSTDGGNHFQAASGVTTLSCVNFAGVAIQGQGPALSFNTGDNDGFYSMDGGRSWTSQDYGGGDNDCSFADPLRPHCMLVFTPRWDTDGNTSTARAGHTVAIYETTPGQLPNGELGTNMRHVVPGPPLAATGDIWNASSGYGIRGFRPIVLNLPGDDVTAPGDYIFIRFFGNTAAVLLRTQQILDIDDRKEWESAGGWRVEKHPRVLADLTGNGRTDIVGFGDAGVWTALSNGDGTFQTPRFVLADFGYVAGSWRVEKHPRFVADLTGNGRADIIGFGDAGVYVALGNGDGTFRDAQLVIPDFGYEVGSWRGEKHPRFLADLRGNGRADIVGFGDAGVFVALGNGDGSFQDPQLVIQDFGYEAGSWRVEKHPRLLADLRGNGRADIVGFGDAGVYVALSNGDGTFTFQAQTVIGDFGYEAGSWLVEKHPRLLADLRGNGRADIIGFGDAGVYVALSNGDGTFTFQAQTVIGDFGYEAGTWRVEKHPRFLADATGNSRADIVGFGDAGVYVALSNGDGTFQDPQLVVEDFGYEAGEWRVEKHPRFLAGVTGSGLADIVGFGDAGVLVAPSNGNGTFRQPALFVVVNFGYADGPLFSPQGPPLPAADASIAQASGGHTKTVFYVGGDSLEQLWKWTDGMPGWKQLVPGGGANRARRFFVNPYSPDLIYLMDTQNIMRSDDGGEHWQIDCSLEQQLTCDRHIPIDRNEESNGQGDHFDVVLTDMKFDPFHPQKRFAVGLAGAFMTNDGVNWERLLDTAALRGRPTNCYYDWISLPSVPALYVGFAGRSLVKISPVP